jgi:hypothetical protein
MTQPLTDPATEFEHARAEEIAGPAARRIQRAARRLAALYVELAGSLEAPLPPDRQLEFKLRATEIIYGARSYTQRRTLRTARQAWRNGVESVPLPPGAIRLKSPPLAADVIQVTMGLDRAVGRDISDAAYLAKTLQIRDWRDVMAAVGKANQAASRIERTVRWVANRAHNAGVAAAADKLGQALVWVPEPDACLTCLSYAGAVAQPGGLFQPAQVFPVSPSGYEIRSVWPSVGPPQHPNCRCRVQSWAGTEDEYSGPDYPQVLQREAQRAVLLGRAQGSEPARLRAADKLLQHVTLAPKSVADRARRAVKAGTFG